MLKTLKKDFGLSSFRKSFQRQAQVFHLSNNGFIKVKDLKKEATNMIEMN